MALLLLCARCLVLFTFGSVNHVLKNSVKQTNALLNTFAANNKNLQKIWEVEDVQLPTVVKLEDALCKQLLKTKTTCDK